jgi:hypothetical protein
MYNLSSDPGEKAGREARDGDVATNRDLDELSKYEKHALLRHTIISKVDIKIDLKHPGVGILCEFTRCCYIKVRGRCNVVTETPFVHDWFDDGAMGGPSNVTAETCEERRKSWEGTCGFGPKAFLPGSTRRVLARYATLKPGATLQEQAMALLLQSGDKEDEHLKNNQQRLGA